MPKETIGPKIKAFRRGRGLTQAQLAKSLGYSHKSVITHIEKGESEMSYEKILLFLRTFDVDANDLFVNKFIEDHEKMKKAEARRNAWIKDILFDIDEELFSYRVGGVLIKNNKILLTKGGDDYSLPGGHVQIGETSQETIIREFEEETGLDVNPINVISTYENFWKWDDRNCHQICIFYRLEMKDVNQQLIPNPDTKETEFVWVDLEELKNITLYPLGLTEQILNNGCNNNHYIVKQK